MEKQYYTVKEVAKILQVHEQTVFRWLKEGQMPHYKAGRYYRITKEQLQSFLEKGK